MTHAEILQRIARIQRELAKLAQAVASSQPPNAITPLQPWHPPPGGYVACYYACSFPDMDGHPPATTWTLTSTPPPDAKK
jgi:hypothetical protein